MGDKHIVVREITLPPGQSTGWHFHDGNLYGLVKQGTLSHFDASCKSDGVYRTGSSIVEPSGTNHVHIGRNLGKTPVVLDVVYAFRRKPAVGGCAEPGMRFPVIRPTPTLRLPQWFCRRTPSDGLARRQMAFLFNMSARGF